jgi:hypothetical protein
MIIKICRGQPELKITFYDLSRCAQSLDLEKTRLVITAPNPKPGNLLSPIIRKGDWGYPPPFPWPPELHAQPAIIYPAFDVDDEGAITFRLDDHLWRRPPGRYIGHVMIGDHEALTIDLDLEPLNWIPSKIELNDPKACP